MEKITPRPRRNPVAAAPILGKGGVHAQSKTAERSKTRAQLRREAAECLRPAPDALPPHQTG